MDQIVDPVPLSRALRRLAYPSPAVRYALKFGTTVAAALWFAYSSELSDKVTIFITVLFVMQPTSGGSIKKGLPRIAGTVASALMCVLIYGMFAQFPPLFLASWCAVIAVGTYGMTGARYPYAWMVFAFTSVIILVKAMAGDDQIETIAFQRASETVIGVLFVVVADSVFWPVRAERRLREGLAHWAGQLADAVRGALGPQAVRQEPSQQAQLPSSPLIPQLGLAEQLGYEMGVSAARVQTFTRIALRLEGLSSRIRVIEREAKSAERTRSSPRGHALAILGDGIAVAITRASQALAGDKSPEPLGEDLDRSLASFEEAAATSSVRGVEGAGAAPEAQEDLRAGALAPALRDLVAVLPNLESALKDLARPESETELSLSNVTLSAGWSWFRPDPIRVQLALRAAIAAGSALIATLAMGWGTEDQLAIIMAVIVAFILAGMSSTRGAAGTIAPGLVAGILLGWIVGDLAIVYLLPHVGRMPMALVYPFAVAGLAGYLIVRGSPLGPLGALFGLVTAILPIFKGSAAPQDVQDSYSLVCGLMLGVAAGFMAQRLLWPRTAMQTFLQRSASELDLFAQAVRDDAVSGSLNLASRLSAYAKQQAQLLQLHQQASHEPVEQALSDERRSKLLALMQELFDASIRPRRESAAITEARNLPAEIDLPLTSLHRALVGEDEALIRSMTLAAGALRGDESRADAGVRAAHAAVEAQIEALRGRDDLTALDRQEVARLISEIASRRVLVEPQLQIESWIIDWRTAAAANHAA
jgi:uncharacterized membrane protein YccC